MKENRKYQTKAVEETKKKLKSGKSTIIVAATGTGKTTIAAHLINEWLAEGKRILFITNKKNLVFQNFETVKEIVEVACGIEMGSYKSAEDDQVVVASIQSISRRVKNFTKNHFDFIIIDEAHHAVAKSYQKVISHFNEAKLLGMTATPNRDDGQNIGDIFESVAFEYTLKQAIEEGYLVPINIIYANLKIDVNNLKSGKNKDFSNHEIAEHLEAYLESIADEMLVLCKNRKTVVFLPLISTSKKFAQILQRKGLKAACISGEDREDKQKEVIDSFKNGELDVLCNAILLTEGWDCPCVDCIVVLRPTKRESFYHQMIGRGTRKCEGKKDLQILEFLWLSQKHKIFGATDLFPKAQDDTIDVSDHEVEVEEVIEEKTAGEEEKGSAEGVREQSLLKALSIKHKLSKGINLTDRQKSYLNYKANSYYDDCAEWDRGYAFWIINIMKENDDKVIDKINPKLNSIEEIFVFIMGYRDEKKTLDPDQYFYW